MKRMGFRRNGTINAEPARFLVRVSTDNGRCPYISTRFSSLSSVVVLESCRGWANLRRLWPNTLKAWRGDESSRRFYEKGIAGGSRKTRPNFWACPKNIHNTSRPAGDPEGRCVHIFSLLPMLRASCIRGTNYNTNITVENISVASH